MYQVKLQQYSGPLEKLLELIEEKKLEITTINLAEVTDSFVNYLRNLGEDAGPQILADFVAVAARLLLIKSKILLPDLELSTEEESEIKDLEKRLEIYREFRLAANHIKTLWHRRNISFSRPLFLGLPPVFYPPRKMTIAHLAEAAKKLIASLKEILLEPKIIKKTLITIEEKIKELLNRFKEVSQHSFKALIKDRSRAEIIVFFLAILHLLKDKLIVVEQNSRFEDIVIKNLR